MGQDMNSILQKIALHKQQEINEAQKKLPLTALMRASMPPTRAFIPALQNKTAAIIAEIKKASPSKGVIRADFDVANIAKIYELHGASCLSVLTDVDFFQGHSQNIAIAKQAVSLPVLRKDFIIDAYQVYESRYLGADCILLIVDLLDDAQLLDYCQLAQELGMAVLVESHTKEELERALPLPTPLMGINNRSLHTFKTELSNAVMLSQDIPSDKLIIAESGINTRTDIDYLLQHNIHCFLIGESLMRHENIGEKLDELLKG